MAATKLPEGGPGAIRKALGIKAEDGPLLLLGGEGEHSRHDFGLWVAAIIEQLFPHTRAIVREPARGIDQGLERLISSMPNENMLIVAPHEIPWRTLAHAADICLITADGPIETGSILQAMAAGLPVIGTPVECVSELIEHGHSGLLAKEIKPRSIASRVEEFMADSTLRWPLTDRARADVYGQFRVQTMVDRYEALYRHMTVDPLMKEAIRLPEDENAIAGHNT